MTTQHLFDAPSSLEQRDAIDAEAIAIVVLLLSGEATVADGAAIRAWRRLSAVHSEAFVCAVRAWRGLTQAALATADPSAPATMRRKAEAPLDRAAAARRPHGRLPAGTPERRHLRCPKKVQLALRKTPPRSV